MENLIERCFVVVALIASSTLPACADAQQSGQFDTCKAVQFGHGVPDVGGALCENSSVSRQYGREIASRMLHDATDLAKAIQDQSMYEETSNSARLQHMFAKLQSMSRDRDLLGSFVIDSHATLLGYSARKHLKYSEMSPPGSGMLAVARAGNITLDCDARIGIARALVRLPMLSDAYLLIVRRVGTKTRSTI